MNDRFKYRIPMFSDKGTFIEFQYLELGDEIECFLCGYNGEPQQCSGLKDKNGKLIYEGDIVMYYQPYKKFGGRVQLEYTETRVVKWDDDYSGYFPFVSANDPEIAVTPMICYCANVEVIGNIYENKDILK